MPRIHCKKPSSSRRGDEIALSIMAEIVQRRRNAELIDLTLLKELVEDDDTSKTTTMTGGSRPESAIDPLCGIQVEIASAKFIHEHEGVTYYFCCAGCQTEFSQNPGQYLATEATTDEAIDPVELKDIDLNP